MSALILSLPATPRTPSRRRLAGPRLWLRSLLARLRAADALHRQRVHLSEMDDHMLRDIGLTRADVAAELRRPMIW